MNPTYDICVIGAGAAGLTTAAFCAKLGASVVLIEKHKMGGECLNFGCVPSKALLAAAKRGDDFHAAMRHVQHAIEAIAPHDSVERFTALGVRVLQGEAVFRDAHTVRVGNDTLHARKFVIATGSKPIVPVEVKTPYLTNETLFELQEKPSHLAILGGGVMGVEMAQAFADLGVKVSLVTRGELLRAFDVEAVAVVRQALLAKGLLLYENATLESVKDYSHLLLATGRMPHFPSSLKSQGVRPIGGLRTTQKHIFMVGDAADEGFSTPLAGTQGAAVAAHLLFKKPLPKAFMNPQVVYIDPPLAQVGETHGDFLRVNFTKNDRAICEGKPQGFIKLYHKKGRVIGVTIVGEAADEQLSLYCLAVQQGVSLSALARLPLAYPTRSEIAKAAAGLYYQDLAKNGFLRWVVSWLKRF